MNDTVATNILQAVLSADHTGLRPVFDGTTGQVTRWVPVRQWDSIDQAAAKDAAAMRRRRGLDKVVKPARGDRMCSYAI